MALINFKRLRWPRFEKDVERIIISNNRFPYEDYQNYQTFFFRILKNVIRYFDMNENDFPDEYIQMIQYYVDMYLISRLRNLIIDLENAKNDLRNEIKEINDRIQRALEIISNSQLHFDQFNDVVLIVDELINIRKHKFKVKWATISKVLDLCGESMVEKVNRRIDVANEIHKKFGDIA